MELLIVLLLALHAYADAANVPTHVFQSTKIYGGVEATPHSIPYQVAIYFDGFLCGGSLISPPMPLALKCGSDSVEVILGAHNIKKQIVVKGKQKIIHEDWGVSGVFTDNIALIELSNSVDLNENIQVVNLAPEESPNFVGSEAFISGWGYTKDDTLLMSDVLRVASSTVIQNRDCQRLLGTDINDGMMCLDGSHGKSTCGGDNGGPLTISEVQIGIASFIVSAGCQKAYPAAFTRVSHYRKWINDHTGV